MSAPRWAPCSRPGWAPEAAGGVRADVVRSRLYASSGPRPCPERRSSRWARRVEKGGERTFVAYLTEVDMVTRAAIQVGDSTIDIRNLGACFAEYVQLNMNDIGDKQIARNKGSGPTLVSGTGKSPALAHLPLEHSGPKPSSPMRTEGQCNAAIIGVFSMLRNRYQSTLLSVK